MRRAAPRVAATRRPNRHRAEPVGATRDLGQREGVRSPAVVALSVRRPARTAAAILRLTRRADRAIRKLACAARVRWRTVAWHPTRPVAASPATAGMRGIAVPAHVSPQLFAGGLKFIRPAGLIISRLIQVVTRLASAPLRSVAAVAAATWAAVEMATAWVVVVAAFLQDRCMFPDRRPIAYR